MKDKNFYSSDMESLNRTVGRVFTNFDPVSGSKTLFKSHRQEVFIFQQSMYGSFHFERKFVNNKDFAYLGRHFLKLLILHPLRRRAASCPKAFWTRRVQNWARRVQNCPFFGHAVSKILRKKNKMRNQKKNFLKFL